MACLYAYGKTEELVWFSISIAMFALAFSIKYDKLKADIKELKKNE